MLAMMWKTQWRWTQIAVWTLAGLAFAFPSLAWRLARRADAPSAVAALLDGFYVLGPILGVLALLGPFIIAALPWSVDHETRHVYTLALPVRWSRFLAMRYAIGALTLLIPAAALYAGCLAVLSRIELPALLQAYPAAMTLRFLLACLLTYSAGFALVYLAGRRATLVALGVVLGIGLLVLGATLFGLQGAVDRAVGLLFRWPGPLAIFVEPWVLIGV
jgi:hypothetical protein